MNRWKKWCGLLLMGYLMFLTGCESGPDSTATNSGNLLRKPPYAGITDSIRRFPHNPTLYLQRALLLSQNNRHEIATADYQKSWEIKEDPNTALEYISNLLTVDEVDKAVRLLEQGIKKFPDNIEFSRRLSEVYSHMGDKNKLQVVIIVELNL